MVCQWFLRKLWCMHCNTRTTRCIVTTFRLSIIVCWGYLEYGRPSVVPLLEDRQEAQILFKMKSKNAGIDVILHVEFDFGIIFNRYCLCIDHPKIIFYNGVCKGVGLKVLAGEALCFAALFVRRLVISMYSGTLVRPAVRP